MQTLAWISRLETLLARTPDLEFRKQLLEMLSQVREQHVQEVSALKKRLAQVQAQLGEKPTQAYRLETVLWTKIDPEYVDGPYCPECYESEGQLMALRTVWEVIAPEFSVQREIWKCPVCAAQYAVIDNPTAELLHDVARGGRD